MQLFVLAALTLTTSLLRVPHGARTMPPAARAATAVASAAPNDDYATKRRLADRNDDWLRYGAWLTASISATANMVAVSAQCGIAITDRKRPYVGRGLTSEWRDGDFHAFHYPEGETFSMWLLEDGLDEDQRAAVMQSAVQAIGCDDEEDVYMRLYDGERSVLEPLLRISWNRLGSSFQQLPNTARWTIQRGEGGLMPVLCDDEDIHLLLSTSAKCIGRSGALIMPDPYHARDPAAGHSDYMCRDLWLEEFNDGGAYVLGLDDTVLIFYIDGPGDMIFGRWQCSRSQWETMWLSVFGSLSVTVES